MKLKTNQQWFWTVFSLNVKNVDEKGSEVFTK